MKNVEIRTEAKKRNVYLWEIAEKLNINDGNFSRKLRKELSEEDKQKILQVIDKIVKQRN